MRADMLLRNFVSKESSCPMIVRYSSELCRRQMRAQFSSILSDVADSQILTRESPRVRSHATDPSVLALSSTTSLNGLYDCPSTLLTQFLRNSPPLRTGSATRNFLVAATRALSVSSGEHKYDAATEQHP